MSPDIGAALGRRLAKYVKTKRLALRNEQPIVSFTFDDFPRSAVTNGARVLEAAGAYGTFYLAGGLAGADVDGRSMATKDEIAELAKRGHEIGCHTFSHARLPKLDAAATEDELARNRAFFTDLVKDGILTNFAYPFGDLTPARKLQLQAEFASCRGISPGINSGTADLGQLKAVALYDHLYSQDQVRALIRQAKAENGWLIFYTHDVEQGPMRYGTTLGLFEFSVNCAKDEGCAILSVRNALGAAAFAPAQTN